MNATKLRNLIPDNILKAFLKKNELKDFEGDISIAAIDIGYGFTKYASDVDAEGNIKTNLFPSLAVLSPQENLSGDFFVSRDTIRIENGGTVWEAGPDINQIATRNDVRALHDNYVTSEQWKVLFLAALSYIDMPVIDMLVLGLPVSGMAKKEAVESITVGKHIIGDKEVEVKSVMVIPQPLGALYNHAINSGEFEKFLNTSTLVIDPGYLTFDFLVTKGFAVNAHRSGARPGGMSAVLNAIASSISKELGENYDDLTEIDLALSLKDYDGIKADRTLWIFGKEIPLNEHIKQTKSVIDSSLNYMLNKMGDSKDISQIIMAGGPNKIFAKSISSAFPQHKANNNISTMSDGIFSNVIGFYLWGLMVSYGKVSN
jgi:plasmid segregation protein ParM